MNVSIEIVLSPTTKLGSEKEGFEGVMNALREKIAQSPKKGGLGKAAVLDKTIHRIDPKHINATKDTP